MSKIKYGGLDQYGKVQTLNRIGSERVKPDTYFKNVTPLMSLDK